MHPAPLAFLVDVEGTLTEFGPSRRTVIEASARFDELASKRDIDLKRLHYVTNAALGPTEASRMSIPCRVHVRAGKPFFNPPEEFIVHGGRTIVVGDQYLTDGLMAWRFGFSFGLVGVAARPPIWPLIQLMAGRALSPLFLRRSS